MKLLLRLPNWLGDAVMAKYAVDSLKKLYGNPQITLVGLKHILELYKEDDYHYRLVEDTSKIEKNRLKALIRLGKQIGKHDIAITFQNSFLSAFLLYVTGSKKRVGMKKELRSFLLTHTLSPSAAHQAYEYLRLASFEQPEVHILKSTGFKTARTSVKNKIGIAPGAAYGSSKRWGAKHFADLIAMQSGYNFHLYGAGGDKEIGEHITAQLQSKKAHNCTNRIGQTTIKELLAEIASCEYFISNDSGSMHLAAALGVPTLAIFGPTDETKTSIWDATPNIVLKKPVPCSPCKHRICPKPIHECMENITPHDVASHIELLSSKILT